jgi:hypothetical protein
MKPAFRRDRDIANTPGHIRPVALTPAARQPYLSGVNRRRFLLTSLAGVLAAPRAAEAQQARKLYRIGLIHVGLDHDPPSLVPLRESLKRLGYDEGQNIRLDYRNQADEQAARRPKPTSGSSLLL